MMMCLECKIKPALKRSNYCAEHQPDTGKTFAKMVVHCCKIKKDNVNIEIIGTKSRQVKRKKAKKK